MPHENEAAGIVTLPGAELFRFVPADHPRNSGATIIAGLRLSSRGRITMPKALRDAMGLKPGDRLEYVPQDDGTYSVRKVG